MLDPVDTEVEDLSRNVRATLVESVEGAVGFLGTLTCVLILRKLLMGTV